VSLKLYDITGRLVSDLVNRDIKAGYHTLSVDLKGMPSGLYFVSMISNGVEEVQKITLIK
jgi:hypothetical protein